MSDQTQAATETSTQTPPAATTTVVTPPPATATTAPKREEITLTSEQLAERLDRARREQLKQLGAENVEDVKKALDEFKAKQELEKTEAQKNAEKLAELDRVKARAAVLEETTKARAQREFALLTDSQKAAVVAIAGEDHAAQLKAIDVLAPTWAASAAQDPPPAAATKTAPAATTTAPPRAAPADNAQTHLTPKEQYLRLKQTDPLKAVAYLNQHAKEIYPSA